MTVRDIRCRGQRKDTLKWVEGYYVYNASTEKHHILDANSVTPWLVVPETVGQYTGLKDKNGKEIYEGDIVNWEWDELYDGGEKIKKYQKWNNEVFWMGEMAQFALSDPKENIGHWTFENEDCRFEVIGNIHSNPELLEVE